MRESFLATLLLLGVLVAAFVEGAAEAQSTGQRTAWIVGNGAHEIVERAAGPANHARLIAGALQSAGFTVIGGGAQDAGGNGLYPAALADAIRRSGLGRVQTFDQVGRAVRRQTAESQFSWLASSPISAPVLLIGGPTITAPVMPVNSPPQAAAAAGPRRFDGYWDVVLNCPSEGVATGYTFRFTAEISDGTLHGVYGDMSQPGSLAIDGKLHDDGSALLSANGRTNRTENNIQSFKNMPPGTPYSYNVQAQFQATRGTGGRLGGARTCNYAFTRR